MNNVMVVSVSVIMKKIKITFIHNFFRGCKIAKRNTSNSYNISDYVKNIKSALYKITLE